MPHPSNRGRQRQERVIVTIGDREHDVSILCSPGNASYKTELSPIRGEFESKARKTRPRQAIQSLYPSTDNLPEIPVAALVFNTTSVHDTPSRYSERRDSRGYNDSQPIHHNNAVTQDNSAPNPAVEDHNHDYGNHDFKRSQVEISPDYWVALRGSAETWHALERGFSREVQCPCCSERILVIQDAALALCPECRTIIPINPNGNGLGLGAKAVHNRRLVGGTTLQSNREKTKTKEYGLKDPPSRSKRGVAEKISEQYPQSKS